MNINEAKTQVKNAMIAYFSKDEFGNYLISKEKQRPVFLLGPAGVGKTAIMAQIAQELDVGLISYSMTHHTRQSALGLPVIVDKEYEGNSYKVSEYTMSEIIGSVYDLMKSTGKKEGILFLDEINCVSETLAPSMLQFLQYKVFGTHKLPDGWIVVTAGNPAEFNDSVRDFDIVTLDRLKKIEVEPDYEAWKKYALSKSIHPSIISYLDIKKDDFYKVETTVDGKSFVTARGWSDLSDMINLYNKHSIVVDEDLISQYIQNEKVAKSFSNYYDLFIKYQSDYNVNDILNGIVNATIKNRAKNARFDERIMLISLLLDKVDSKLKDVMLTNNMVDELAKRLQRVKLAILANEDISKSINHEISECKELVDNKSKYNGLSYDEYYSTNLLIKVLEDINKELFESYLDNNEAFNKIIKGTYNQTLKQLKIDVKQAQNMLDNLFKFVKEVFGNDHELLIVVSELTIRHYSSSFISKYSNNEYFKNNKELLFYKRLSDIDDSLANIDFD